MFDETIVFLLICSDSGHPAGKFQPDWAEICYVSYQAYFKDRFLTANQIFRQMEWEINALRQQYPDYSDYY